jgi:hypothetical protein
MRNRGGIIVADLAVLDLYGAERTGGYAATAAYAHLDGKQHGRFPRLLLLQKLAAARPGGPAQAVLRIADHGITFSEVYIGVFVHGRGLNRRGSKCRGLNCRGLNCRRLRSLYIEKSL